MGGHGHPEVTVAFERQITNGDHADLVLIADGGVSGFYGNRQLLAAVSEVFKGLFFGGPTGLEEFIEATKSLSLQSTSSSGGTGGGKNGSSASASSSSSKSSRKKAA